MITYYDKEVYSKEDWMDEMASYLSGTCSNTVDQLMNDEDFLPGIKFWNITEAEFEQFLVDVDIHECGTCGWWTYSGEGNGIDCDDCERDAEENHDED